MGSLRRRLCAGRLHVDRALAHTEEMTRTKDRFPQLPVVLEEVPLGDSETAALLRALRMLLQENGAGKPKEGGSRQRNFWE
jgi:hypothetical protein